ncbi:neutral/alkaline non-lysosomal ceramidase N-terminal domain-containing protein [Thermopirellula anaerolimosa]
MRQRKRRYLESARMSAACWVLGMIVLFTSPHRAEGEEPAKGFQAGAAVAIITPPNGIPMAGYYSPRGSEGVLDDLFAKALVLDDGEKAAAFVACDLISIPQTITDEARRRVAAEVPIPPEAVLISATHTHTGPSLPRGSKRDALDGGASDIASTYAAELPAKIAEAVVAAYRGRTPASTFVARYEEHDISYNRRFWMSDGTVGWNPGKLNPKIIRPVGPIDPELLVLYVETADRRPAAAYVNFALHADTTGGTLVSADYSGALARRLAENKGADFVTLFGNGACGDINHIDVRSPVAQKGPAEAGRIGTVLAGDVFKALMRMRPTSKGPLQTASRIVPLPLAPITDEDVKRAREITSQGDKAPFLDKVFAYKVLDIAARNGEPLAAEVQVITLGDDLAWVALPGEVFVTLGLNIKAASPFRHTFVVELANGSLGYIPHRSAYAEGQYEAISARCAEGSGELLVAQVVEMLKELYGKAATP